MKQVVDTERVSVRTFAEEEQIILRDCIDRGQVDVTRVAIDRVVPKAPPVRTEGNLTVIPVLEERVVVEKHLVLVEEIHVRRTVVSERVEMPATVRRMRVEVERSQPQPRTPQEEQ